VKNARIQKATVNKILFFRKNLKWFCFASLLIKGLIWHLHQSEMVSLRIPTISGKHEIIQLPKQDKELLEHFFQVIMISDSGFYTLLGSKPMTLSSYNKPFSLVSWRKFYYSLLPDNIEMYRAWKVWLKYQHLFNHPRFAFWDEANPWGMEDDYIILFVNQAEANSMIKRYDKDFSTVLQKNQTTIEELIEQSKKQPLFLKGFKKHEGLIGTLLGFGRENAWLFHRRSLGEKISLSGFLDPENHIEILQEFGDHLHSVKNKKNRFSVFFLPCFVADINSLETKTLRETYELSRKKIIALYEGKDFLETTLNFLCSDP